MTSKERYGSAMMRTLGTPLAVLVRGEGCHVWDEDGMRYLDFLSGIAVNALGHAHPAMINAVTRQMGTLAHVSNYFATPPQIELAERLKRLTGAGDAGRVYFCNSGAEANEAAFKLARLNTHGINRTEAQVTAHAKPRTRILALHDSFHGRTMGALALSGKPMMSAPFQPVPAGVEHIDTTIAALEAALDDTVAAIFLEPVKGEAGVIPLPDGFLLRARELCTEHGVLLVLDEVQTGVGRSGEWFAYNHAGILPDAVALAKGMGGGVPIGALVTFGAASDLFTLGQHGSTYAGNPLMTATSNAVLGVIEDEGLVQNAKRRGEQLREIILGFDSPLIAEVRGLGLLLGIGLTEPVAQKLAAAALAHGLIVNAANETSIRLAPPLIVGDAELAEFAEKFGQALASL